MRGDGRVYQRGRRWWLEYWNRGEQFREPGGKTEDAARKKLRARFREIAGETFAGLKAERVTVAELLDELLAFSENNGKRAAHKMRSHLQAVRSFFGLSRAVDVTSSTIERYKAQRLRAGKAPATVNREMEGLRQAFNYAAKQTPPTFPRHRVPHIPLLAVDNVREGYFERADFEALQKHIEDPDVRDFIGWGFRTGMRKGSIAKLTWDMLDTKSWTLTLPGTITKNKARQVLKLDGEVQTIMERRVKARRLDCPLIFHRVSKGQPGQPVKDFTLAWRKALKTAGLPAGRLFHDLRRSAVRNLLNAGVDPAVAMKVSGHKTMAMLSRYNVISEQQTAAAFRKTDEYLSTQPTANNVVPLAVPAQFPHNSKKANA